MAMKKQYRIGTAAALLLLLLTAAGCSEKEEKTAPEDRILMVNDTLYYGTEEKGPMGDADCVEGEILSSAEAGAVPEENGQSNFGGIGNPYTFDSGDGAIMVFVDEEYYWFYAKDGKGPENAGETEGQGEVLEPSGLPGVFPCDFVFSSGAGAWGTFLTLDADGSFTGGYNDSDMGDTGEGYPHGKNYYCEFQGKFGNFEKIDETTVSMTLKELTFEPEAGSEEIRDEILYVGAEPLGLESGTEFIFYLPEKSPADLPEEFLNWWPGRYEWDKETEKELGCYGILNRETEAGFFSDTVCTACKAAAVSPQTGICGKCGAEQ